MVKIVPQAYAKSASMGWFFDPGFIQNVQRIAAEVENQSMELIDSVLFAMRETSPVAHWRSHARGLQR